MFNCSLPSAFKRALTALLLMSSAVVVQAEQTAEDWSDVVQEARGSTVFFYAWGGSNSVNQYLRWAGRHLNRQYGINLRHVKVSDIAEAVHRLRSDQAAGRKQGGAIDLLWINGENFHALKESKLLEPDLLSAIPNHVHLLTDELPLLTDFGVPVDGFEVPWGMGQFNIIARDGSFAEPAITPEQLLAYAEQNPGRLSYPKPPDFIGTTFLKSLLQALADNDERLYREPSRSAERDLLPVLWDYLDQLHPLLWKKGQAFPKDSAQQLQWLADGQLHAAFSFNPQEMDSKVGNGRLPETVTQHYFAQGAITNSHYLAVPHNASHKAAAKVVINFLISRSAQARKADPRYWGDPAVVRLDEAEALLPTAQELHAGWQERLEAHWLARYQ
ncbi:MULTISPECIES: ABC transporter substrate-binding protein [unclassified Marinimicrobium]|jgi:putative thiamine transport system substrate-binding protein|uniref:ABC transporter substrate-binding protein n=1 Tax=unclassified Marinimicrobium TaxID=2632100 RepID=UPI000C5B0AEE|nr:MULTISPECIES: ABC transporter substrate-binding protein [unclassified Marinimicrobium]MAN53233.1 ABC transporter substrate-binding protein [Marinimicrobium sp.]